MKAIFVNCNKKTEIEMKIEYTTDITLRSMLDKRSQEIFRGSPHKFGKFKQDHIMYALYTAAGCWPWWPVHIVSLAVQIYMATVCQCPPQLSSSNGA